MVNLLQQFPSSFLEYLMLIVPGLAAGFLASGLVHEFAPDFWVKQGVGKGGLRSILFVSISGALLPLCSWAELPLALSFYKKGVRLGPVLAFLLTAPATSLISLILAYRVLGLNWALYVLGAVILMGVVVGVAGNLFPARSKYAAEADAQAIDRAQSDFQEFFKLRSHKKRPGQRLRDALRYGFVDLLKETGPGILAGILIAALLNNNAAIEGLFRRNLSGLQGYIFICLLSATMLHTSYSSVFLASSFLLQGLGTGPTMSFLLLSPVLSYATIFVLKKEFGIKVMLSYILMVAGLALLLGHLFSWTGVRGI